MFTSASSIPPRSNSFVFVPRFWYAHFLVSLFYRETVKYVPASRLVGIELNPGPPRSKQKLPTNNPVTRDLKSLVSDAGAFLGQFAANRSMSSRTKKKKRSKNKKQTQLTGFGESNSHTSISVPVSYGRKDVLNVKRGLFRTPFVATSLFVQLDVGSNVSFVPKPDTSLPAGPFFVDISPQSVVSTVNNTTFTVLGVPMNNLSNSFIKYRLRNMRMTYNGAVSTSTPGNIAIAYVPDAVNNPGRPAFDQICAIEGNIQTEVWARNVTKNITNLDTDWKYTTFTGSPADPADERLMFPGSISISSFGVAISPVETRIIASVRLEGEMEFCDVAPTGTIIASNSLITSSGPTSVYEAIQLGNDATRVTPFGTVNANTYQQTTLGPLNVVLSGTSLVISGYGQNPTATLIQIYWEDVTGVIATQASNFSISSGFGVTSTVGIATAPYSFQDVIVGDGSSDTLTIAFLGPNNMTAGQARIAISARL